MVMILFFLLALGATAHEEVFTCSDCIDFWENVREAGGCYGGGIICALAEKVFNVNGTVCQSVVDMICAAGCSQDPSTCSLTACTLIGPCAGVHTCRVPNKNYTFPVSPITGDYFQWLRQIDDNTTRNHFRTATIAQMTSFLDARVAHILQHLAGTTGPHTVCLPSEFIEDAIQTDKRHWQQDYFYWHRLLNIFPSIPYNQTQSSEMETLYAQAMKF